MKRGRRLTKWGALGLAPESVAALRVVAAHAGVGVVALVGGTPAERSRAAEAIANEQDVNLYRIDLSEVVSAYIGETEKNLRRVFDAAQGGGGILLFEEADALFGRRSEVKDSHDRYANIEVNFLLNLLEDYPGLVIVATNGALDPDPMLQRRLRHVVMLSTPEEEDKD